MENQGFLTQLLEGKGSLTTMPPTRNMLPKASPLSAKAKGLRPITPDTQPKLVTPWTTTTNHRLQEIATAPTRSQASVTCRHHASPLGPPPSYKAPATEGNHILFLHRAKSVANAAAH